MVASKRGIAGYLGFSCSRFWQYSTSPPVKLLTCLTSMLLHIAHVAFLWSFGELTSSIESISHKQRGVMGKHVTHTPLKINGWNIIPWRFGRSFSFLNWWFVGSMLIFQGVIWPENVETHYLCLEDDMEDIYQFLAEWFMYTMDAIGIVSLWMSWRQSIYSAILQGEPVPLISMYIPLGVITPVTHL